jgi:hypothetical protein
MTDRVDGYLRGEIDPADLTPAERAQGEALRQALEETRAFVDAHAPPDVTAAVMARVAHADRPTRRGWSVGGLAAACWAPRDVSFRLRPAYGLLAAAAIAWLVMATPGDRPAPSPIPPLVYVQFHLQATGVSTVRLAGTFTDWEPRHALYESAPGVWTVTVALPPGVHDYAFVVDGQQWMPDPHAPTVDDGFGGRNSRIALLPPDASRS